MAIDSNKCEPSDKGDFSLTDQRDFYQSGLRQDWRWEPTDWLTAKAGFDAKRDVASYDYHSHIAELRVNSADELLDYAKHYILGVEHVFGGAVSARLEAYYKDMSHLSPTWTNLRDHLEVFAEQRNDNARIVYNGHQQSGVFHGTTPRFSDRHVRRLGNVAAELPSGPRRRPV